MCVKIRPPTPSPFCSQIAATTTTLRPTPLPVTVSVVLLLLTLYPTRRQHQHLRQLRRQRLHPVSSLIFSCVTHLTTFSTTSNTSATNAITNAVTNGTPRWVSHSSTLCAATTNGNVQSISRLWPVHWHQLHLVC
jgi:hypothetical protein